MRFKLFVSASAITLISGCASMYEKLDGSIDKSDTKLSSLVKDVGRTAPGVIVKSTPSAEYESGIWLSKNVVKLGPAALPPIFYEQVTFDRTVYSLSELAERITLRSGMPTKVSPDALAIASGSPSTSVSSSTNTTNAATGSLGASGIVGAPKQKSAIRINYTNGNFISFLDTVAARFGVYWKYVNGTVQFFHTDSRTFQINAIPGDSTFSATVASGASNSGGGSSGGSSGGASGGVTSNNSQNTAVNSQLSVYSSIEKTIIAMLSSYGKVVASPATGTMTVVDTPDSLDRVSAYVEAENKSLSRQISINVTVLAVTLSKNDNYGIKWDLIYQGLLSKYGIKNSLGDTGTAFSAGILQTSSSKFAGSELVIQALSEQGKVRRETTASVVTLNNQPVPVQVAKQTSYLKSSQTTFNGVVGTPTTTLSPGSITSGFNMSILPHVLNNGTVMLQFSTDISALRSIRTVTSNGTTIESPEIDTRNFLQRVSMKSNETLIISGFEQTDDNLDQTGVGSPKNFLMGGGFKGSTSKEVMVILITPSTMSGS